MTRTYAARKLLALGPLTLREFADITGWPYRVVRGTISHLQQAGVIEWDGKWRLA